MNESESQRIERYKEQNLEMAYRRIVALEKAIVDALGLLKGVPGGEHARHALCSVMGPISACTCLETTGERSKKVAESVTNMESAE